MGRPKKKHTAPTQPTLRAEGSSRKRTPLNQFDPAAGGDIYEPEIIVAMRVAKGITQWQVKWKGYDTRANTWEPIEHLAGCEDMIAAFTEKKREEDEAFQKAADAIKAKKRAEEEEHRRQAVAEAAAAPVRAAVDAARGAARAMDLDLHDTGVRQQPKQGNTHSKRTSEIWACYTEEGAKIKHAICVLPHRDAPDQKCSEEITFSSGTTALWNHVMWHHPDEYVKLNKEKSMKKGEPGMPSGVPAQLPKIPASLRDELHKLHARWLTKKKRPLSVVEDKEYRDIWRKALNGTYTPPDHTTLRGFILELSNEGQQRVATVNETLRRDHLKPSIAGDIWSSANHSISLLGITQYHINNNWEIEELLVAAEPFSRESHTGALNHY